jgi:hypothetical protein
MKDEIIPVKTNNKLIEVKASYYRCQMKKVDDFISVCGGLDEAIKVFNDWYIGGKTVNDILNKDILGAKIFYGFMEIYWQHEHQKMRHKKEIDRLHDYISRLKKQYGISKESEEQNER